MSIDLSKATAISDPYGAWKQITDASGRVLWSAKPKTAIVTLTADIFSEKNYAAAEIWYNTHDNESGYLTTAGEYELPIGTTIDFYVDVNDSSSAEGSISLNGEVVDNTNKSEMKGYATYSHTLTTNLIVNPVNKYYNGGEINITEYPVGAVVLDVEKITSDTYAGETTYTGEQFILLDIYPKTNGTVKVTYGGLTKTITDTSGAAEPNAQQVFFGTFNGVTDSVTTPTSGTLTIEGKCAAFGVGTFQKSIKETDVGYCSCVTGVSEWGDAEYIPAYAFYECKKMVSCEMPDSILRIGQYAFYYCIKLASVRLSNSITSIPDYALYSCNSLNALTIPSGITEIGAQAVSNANSNSNTNPFYVTMLPTTPPTLGDTAFAKNGIAQFAVPKGTLSAYQAASTWGDYASYITEASE